MTVKGCIAGFNGERRDPISINSFLGNGYRAYNPVLMRFHCPDNISPFGKGGINPYVYCDSDPVNHADPTGHLSWQSWLGIGMGVVGLGLAIVSAGASLAAAGGVMAAIESASAVSLAGTTLGVIADVTAIASGAMEESWPTLSSMLGWVALGSGAAGMAQAIYFIMTGGIRGLNKLTAGLRQQLGNIKKVGLSGRGALSEDVRLSGMGFEKVEQHNWSSYLYHYTNNINYHRILSDNHINSSFKNLVGEDMSYSMGVYATDIRPNSRDNSTLSSAIFGISFRRRIIERTYYYFKLETGNLPAGSHIYRSAENENIYLLRPNVMDLSVKLRGIRPPNRPVDYITHDVLGRHGRSSDYRRFHSFNPDFPSTDTGCDLCEGEE